ncbi:hypothetical protein IGI37_001660 [Enterococcus sp. AZ194]|uniref:helix-turn-helix domain-containing protein n=1 Tax=Enterococcus sp. AZ194 TaxID=2774629 RepID=UPI003F246279
MKNTVEHNKIIARRIQELAESKNLSANRISILADLTPSTVDSIYKGRSKNPTIKTIYNICKALDISLTEFFDFSPYNENPNSSQQSKEDLIEYVGKLSREIERIQEELKQESK